MLRLDQLHKSFGSLVAVDGLSLDVAPGEVFGLLGPNGAGKSTTIGMAVGLVAPDSGTVTLRGTPSLREGRSDPTVSGSPTDPARRKLLGVATQSVALYDEMSGDENLRFFAKLYGLRGAAISSRIGTVLEQVGLTARRNDRVKVYSGGMKRRLNLAVALAHDPPLLLLDEPTAGVDPQSRNNILDLVRSLAAAGKAVLYTTHYMEEAARLCSRVAIMDKGRILATGSVPDLIATHGGRSAVVLTRESGEERVETDDPAAEIARAMTNKDVRTARIERPDLEAVFLSLTGRSLRD